MRITGTASVYDETGCEGVRWIVQPDETPAGVDPRDAMVHIESGDHLVLTDHAGTVVFDGVIDEDRETGWVEYERNPGYGQPVALNRYIHWTQRGFLPDQWAAFFLSETLRAVLERAAAPELFENGTRVPPGVRLGRIGS